MVKEGVKKNLKADNESRLASAGRVSLLHDPERMTIFNDATFNKSFQYALRKVRNV